MIDLETGTELLGDGTCVVSVAGELDLHTAPRLEEELLGALRSGVAAMVVDLTECTFIDATALAILLRANTQLEKGPGGLSLVTADRNIRRVFEITGLDAVFAIHPSRAEATNGRDPAAEGEEAVVSRPERFVVAGTAGVDRASNAVAE